MMNFQDSIDSHIKMMITKEKCIEFYDNYDLGANRDGNYIHIEDYDDEYIDFVWEEFEYHEHLTDSEKLKVLTRLLIDNIDDRINTQDILDDIYNDIWVNLQGSYVRREIRRQFEYIYHQNVEDNLNEKNRYIASFDIAILKIKRSKIYNFGLGLKLNMISAGII